MKIVSNYNFYTDDFGVERVTVRFNIGIPKEFLYKVLMESS